ncbi:hypothetical protein ACJMK2_013261, partial [Sinanodonta woodiana]
NSNKQQPVGELQKQPQKEEPIPTTITGKYQEQSNRQVRTLANPSQSKSQQGDLKQLQEEQ